MRALSQAAFSLWAKKPRDGEAHWLPLAVHLADCAAVAAIIWDDWLSEGVKRAIADALSLPMDARRLLIFLAAAHDCGKAMPAFQAKSSNFIPTDLDFRIEEGILACDLPIQPYRDFSNPNVTPHALATEVLLRREGFGAGICAILGAHHGKPTSDHDLRYGQIESHPTNYHMARTGEAQWTGVQREFIAYALRLCGAQHADELPVPNQAAQVLLSGLVIMADWIASNERNFPYIRIGDDARALCPKRRADQAWDRLNLPKPWDWDDLWMQPITQYDHRFSFSPRKVQLEAAAVVSQIYEPGILVLEAATGIGKTEIALAAAEALGKKSKRTGVFFALPTQATSDGIFPRVHDWVDRLGGEHTIRLAHGKAQFNREYRALLEGGNAIYEEEGGAFVHSWFEGQKKALLADFVVGTIDQLLMMALQQKHVMLRHLGLSNKVVVIDECHAYDAYMNQYLEMALRWLGAYRVPVVVLSATLPMRRRRALIEAYQNAERPPSVRGDFLRSKQPPEAPKEDDWAKSRAYPLLTYTDGAQIKSAALMDDSAPRTVAIEYLDEASLGDKLAELLSDGGCAGVIVNTVARAQAIAAAMRRQFGEEHVQLLHANYLAPDRAKNEETLLCALGKPGASDRPDLCVVVGTQVLEQSLDIDFDVLITDLCPMDLLIQRIGRMHRHLRKRKPRLEKAVCLILQMADGSYTKGTAEIYQAYPLMRTQALLPAQIVLPLDVPNLVQDVYDDRIPLPQEPPGYAEAKAAWDERTLRKERCANTFRVSAPSKAFTSTITGWLSRDVKGASEQLSQQLGEAKVRDTDESFEVLLIIDDGDAYRFLPWIEGGRAILPNALPDAEAQALARQKIRLPRRLCADYIIEQTIKELEARNAGRFDAWRESPWLKGELFLPLDANLTAQLSGFTLCYDRLDGLSYEKEGTLDGGQGI